MNTILAFVLVLTASLSAQAGVRNVVTCADELTKVTVNTSGNFGSDEYEVVLTDLRSREELSYRAVLNDGSFSDEAGVNPTINTSPTSIAFIKAGWGLVVLEDCVFDLKLLEPQWYGSL